MRPRLEPRQADAKVFADVRSSQVDRHPVHETASVLSIVDLVPPLEKTEERFLRDLLARPSVSSDQGGSASDAHERLGKEAVEVLGDGRLDSPRVELHHPDYARAAPNVQRDVATPPAQLSRIDARVRTRFHVGTASVPRWSGCRGERPRRR